MSKMKEVAALLGVEIGEEFGATGKDNTYKITDSGVSYKARGGEWLETFGCTLYELLIGKRKIVKKPWKPKNGEEFFVCLEKGVVADRWADCTADLMVYAAGNVFRTREEAEAHSKEILERLQKIYDEGKPLIGADEWRDKV